MVDTIIKYLAIAITSVVFGAGLYMIRSYFRERKLDEEEEKTKNEVENQVKKKRSLVGACNAADDLHRVRDEKG